MADLRKLLAEATPGPWTLDHHGVDDCLADVWTEPGEDEERICENATAEDARLIVLAPTLAAEVISLREREARLVEALRWMGAERNKQMRTADYHGDDCRCYRCAEDAVFAALAEIEKEAGE